MKYAIVESGGKQFRAVEGGTLEVDRLPANAGDLLHLERVLLLVDGETIQVGTPTVPGVAVTATVLDHIKGEKVLSFRYRAKKRIRRRIGHRQQYTRLQVEHIGAPGDFKPQAAAPKAKKAAEPKAAKAAEPEGKKAAEPKKTKPAGKGEAKPAARTRKPAAGK